MPRAEGEPQVGDRWRLVEWYLLIDKIEDLLDAMIPGHAYHQAVAEQAKVHFDAIYHETGHGVKGVLVTRPIQGIPMQPITEEERPFCLVLRVSEHGPQVTRWAPRAEG